MVALMCFVFLKQTMPPLALVAVILISAGIFMLALFEKLDSDKARKDEAVSVDRKYERSALAIIFPVLYLIIDAMGTFLDGLYFDFAMPEIFYRGITEETVEVVCNISYELTFMFVGIISAIYVLCIKKDKITLKNDKFKGVAAVFETIGQFTYVFALSGNAIVAAPAIGSYTVFSVLWSHIFLREKLQKKQYFVIGMVLVGVILLAILDM